MNCPRCAVALAARTVLDVEVDRCPACAGVWLDRGEVERASRPTGRFVDAMRRPADVPVRLEVAGTTRLLRCPRCARSCFRERYSSTEVEIDRCGKGCGVWLDQGELEKIAEHRRRTIDDLAARASGAERAVESERDFTRAYLDLA